MAQHSDNARDHTGPTPATLTPGPQLSAQAWLGTVVAVCTGAYMHTPMASKAAGADNRLSAGQLHTNARPPALCASMPAPVQ
jgi:hypothetical protein